MLNRFLQLQTYMITSISHINTAADALYDGVSCVAINPRFDSRETFVATMAQRFLDLIGSGFADFLETNKDDIAKNGFEVITGFEHEIEILLLPSGFPSNDDLCNTVCIAIDAFISGTLTKMGVEEGFMEEIDPDELEHPLHTFLEACKRKAMKAARRAVVSSKKGAKEGTEKGAKKAAKKKAKTEAKKKAKTCGELLSKGHSGELKDTFFDKIPTDIVNQMLPYLHGDIMTAADQLYDKLVPLIINPVFCPRATFIKLMTDKYLEVFGPDFASFLERNKKLIESDGFGALIDVASNKVARFICPIVDIDVWSDDGFSDALWIVDENFIYKTLVTMAVNENFISRIEGYNDVSLLSKYMNDLHSSQHG